MAEFGIDGMEQVLKNLEKLQSNEARKALKSGIRKGAAEIRKQARANAKKIDDPKTSEAIYKNVKSKMWKNPKRKQYIGASVGVNSTPNSDNDTFYWRFLEFGTSKMRAKPFLTPALEQTKSRALEAMKEGARQMITKLRS